MLSRTAADGMAASGPPASDQVRVAGGRAAPSPVAPDWDPASEDWSSPTTVDGPVVSRTAVGADELPVARAVGIDGIETSLAPNRPPSRPSPRARSNFLGGHRGRGAASGATVPDDGAGAAQSAAMPLNQPAAQPGPPSTAAPTANPTPAVAPAAAAATPEVTTVSRSEPPPDGGSAGLRDLSAGAVDELADRLAGPILRRLRTQLLVDRERRGMRTDLR